MLNQLPEEIIWYIWKKYYDRHILTHIKPLCKNLLHTGKNSVIPCGQPVENGSRWCTRCTYGIIEYY